MASIKCGHCKNTHVSVEMVRNCAFAQHVDNTPTEADFTFVRNLIKNSDPKMSVEEIRAWFVTFKTHELESVRLDTQRWLNALDQILAETPAPAAPQPVTEAGMYQKPNGTVYRVKISQKSGFPYAEKLVPGKYGKVAFEYAAYAVKELTADMRMTVEAASKAGVKYGACCVCGRTLTNPDSVKAGIGPWCASKI